MALRFEALFPEGICPGWSIVVRGETSSSSSMFEINLLGDPGDQIALHFNPRFSCSRIICNSFLDSHWGKEEVNTTFPFEAKEPFQVEIYSDQDYFHIFINENKVLQYKHRQKNLSSITKLQILNDIDISSVEITKRVSRTCEEEAAAANHNTECHKVDIYESVKKVMMFFRL